MDINKLLGKMVENGFNKTTFAKAIDMPYQTFIRKLEGGEKSFTLGEVQRMALALNCSEAEFKLIFLARMS